MPGWKHADVTPDWQNLLQVTPEEIRALYRSRELWDARRAFNDSILPHGSSTVVLSDDDRRRLTIDQQQRLVQETMHEANSDSAATAAKRRDAVRLIRT